MQMTWLPNLPFYVQLGAEALQGDNEGFSAQLGERGEPLLRREAGAAALHGLPQGGAERGLRPRRAARRVLRVFAAASGDPGRRSRGDHCAPGTAKLLGLDFVWKYDSTSTYGKKDLTFQAEYLRRVRDLEIVVEGEAPRDPALPAEATQDGLYAQVVYGFLARWTVGLRWDAFGLTNEIRSGSEKRDLEASTRFSANLTFNPTEFSRLRAQFDHGEFRVGGVKETFNQVFVQFQMSLGAHGAHRF